MTDEIQRDRPIEEPGRERDGSVLESTPRASTPPGDPREAQEPQEPRSAHVDPQVGQTLGRDSGEPPLETRGRDEEQTYGRSHDPDEESNEPRVVDQLREAWDRLRGK
jgi:hypothetical protein